MDYLPIGLQATDVLVDKHFHRIPDKAFRSETYRPRIPTKLSRRKRREEKERRNSRDQGVDPERRRDSRDSRDPGERDDWERATQKRQEEPYSNPEIEEAGYDSEPDYTSRQRERNMRDRNWDSKWERDSDLRDIPRHSGAGTGTGYVYGYPYEKSDRSNSPPSQIYSQQPPRLRPEYLPKYGAPRPLDPASKNPYYFPPPPIATFPDPFDRDERRGNYDSDERYEKERTRRPKPIQRSSSYDDIHSQRKSYPSNQDQRLSTRNASRTPRSDHGGSKDSHTGTMKDRAERYGVKDEVKGLFTDSPQGLAGGAIGALVGGWATEKFQESQSGKDRKDMGDRAKIITLLGAAAGGLVANAVVDKWQDGKEETKKKQKKWDKKYPDGKTDDNGERGDRDEGRNGESERERRDSVRSRDASRRDRNRDDSRERDMSYDEKIRRSDGRRYEGVNDGYY
ncbi:hypothetical protein BCIN_13g01790 [Botrytis cinerea B05.10]|uniref:Uncharacterized protein n=2 Tax=Botryotinia fuckeliana TaxID=40559 RepID=A0A384K0M1_BOTFB|nr:hypothetical protein BCIN_13g01790 [Botrytis cinerea B05.10]ATZ56338.1 hypothetical protein BCIN_13g01790 [Botrytis cinerea B05.10]EMR81223.1 hypothetical protein BcDW1_10212 [Botrytis cinerea BcDW1]